MSLAIAILSVTLIGAACSKQTTTNLNQSTTNENTSVTNTELTNLGVENTNVTANTNATSANNTNSDSSSANTNTAPTTVTVSVTNTGFTPSSLTIKKGTTVIFQNNGTREHQVGSDPHPDHTDYPEFSLDDMAPGTSTQFRFDKVGVWGYHNHNYDELTATITVTE